MQLLGCRVVACLVFKEIGNVSFIAPVQFYIPANKVGVIQFLCVLEWEKFEQQK